METLTLTRPQIQVLNSVIAGVFQDDWVYRRLARRDQLVLRDVLDKLTEHDGAWPRPKLKSPVEKR